MHLICSEIAELFISNFFTAHCGHHNLKVDANQIVTAYSCCQRCMQVGPFKNLHLPCVQAGLGPYSL